MNEDPIVAEVRNVRERLAKDCDYDFAKMLARDRQFYGQWKGKKLAKPLHPEWRPPHAAAMAKESGEYRTGGNLGNGKNTRKMAESAQIGKKTKKTAKSDNKSGILSKLCDRMAVRGHTSGQYMAGRDGPAERTAAFGWFCSRIGECKMTIVAQNIMDEALELPIEERLSLIDLLLHSANLPTRANIDIAWRAEVDRRDAEIDNGTEQLVKGEDVLGYNEG